MFPICFGVRAARRRFHKPRLAGTVWIRPAGTPFISSALCFTTPPILPRSSGAPFERPILCILLASVFFALPVGAPAFMRGGALQRSDRNCALNLRFSAGPYSAPIQRCVILNEVKNPNAARLATALSLRVHFRLYELVTTMLTSVVRFNYNSARANQSPDTSCPPPSAAHLTPRIPSSWHRPSSLKNPRRLIANPRLEFHYKPHKNQRTKIS